MSKTKKVTIKDFRLRLSNLRVKELLEKEEEFHNEVEQPPIQQADVVQVVIVQH